MGKEPDVDHQAPAALVTGGGNGIGRACALAYAAEGAAVAVCDIEQDSAQAVAAAIERAGGRAITCPVDVGDPEQVTQAVDHTVRAFGRIDYCVHAAGMAAAAAAVVDTENDVWDRVMQVNLNGTFYVLRSVASQMRRQGQGSIMLIASDRALYGAKARAPYATSKAGVIVLMKSAALELGEHGVTVNALNPGTTDTRLVRQHLTDEEWDHRASYDPLGRFSTPENVAEVAHFYTTKARTYVTGQLITMRMRAG